MASARAKPRAKSAGRKSRSRRSPSKSRKATAKAAKAERSSSTAAPEVAVAIENSAFVLPDSLDSASAFEIRAELLARRGTPLRVDAGSVRRVGVQALQILIAAARTWQSDGQEYVVANPSSELLDTIALIGLPREHFIFEGMPQ